MPVYVIAEIKVTDASWLSGYAASVHDIVYRHFGHYLARSGNIETIEGEPSETSLIALIEFPSKHAAAAFAADPAYAPFANLRRRGSESRLTLTDDTDLAGTIGYLPKG